MKAARRFLARSGRKAFLAEYQHDFESDKSECVLKHWRDSIHVITWSEFAKVFGTRSVPDRWYKHVFHDWARTKTQYHANVAGFVTVSSQSAPLPGFTFMYDCMSFKAGTEPEDVALRILKTISRAVPGGGSWDDLIKANLTRAGIERFAASATDTLQARRDVLAHVIPDRARRAFEGRHFMYWRMSHEAKSARDIYRLVFGLPFQPSNPGAAGGVDMLNHLMMVDETRAHPFKEGVMGFTRFFLIVDDEKALEPTSVIPDDLHDSDLARYQLKRWRNLPPKLSESGEVERGLLKVNDDYGNGLMMLYHDNCVQAAPMTEAEERDARRPAGISNAAMAAETDPRVQSAIIMSQQIFDAEREEEERSRARGSRFPFGSSSEDDEPFYLDW